MILADLKKGVKVTPLNALSDYGCFRLGARIHDLKRQGYNIKSEMVTNVQGKRFARYSLEG
jgi:hypothetical protein